MWRRVIAPKYGNERGESGDWCSKLVVGPNGVGLWKHSRRGWDNFYPFISYEVGYGTNVHFWQDWWCGEQPPIIEDFRV